MTSATLNSDQVIQTTLAELPKKWSKRFIRKSLKTPIKITITTLKQTPKQDALQMLKNFKLLKAKRSAVETLREMRDAR